MNLIRFLWVCASALLLQVHLSIAKRDKDLYCSICRAVVDEVHARIGDVDPSKKVKVGSFRVDPEGNQKLVEKQYARSDVHLTEVFEDVCNTMDDYALTQAPGGKIGITRIKSRTGEDLDTTNVGYNENLRQTFKAYCESMIEDFEDEMLGLFKLENLQSVEAEICGEVAKACSEDDLARPITRLEEKKEHRRNSFHELEPTEEDEEEEIMEDEDLKSNIVEPSASKKKDKKKGQKEEL
ncbi:protein canopy homolog 2-like [Littorina saxatilis]|uniref:Saposin B-type domain-containing protein n=1 Tax=Littorina saxatilis TaxID=31220 RepID=A0AAN9GPF9_9CAEN